MKTVAAFLLGCVVVGAPALDLTDEMTPPASAAAVAGLAYLASSQQADGTWNGEGNYIGVVASCALALMAHGHLPGRGQHGVITARALQYLLRHAAPDGLIYNPDAGPHAMYHHGLATLALAEAWGQTSDPRLRDVVKRAVDLICASQNGKGGWRYQPKISDDDLSVTVMQLMALRAAKDAGLAVPKEVIDAGTGYVLSCFNPKDGGFSYEPNEPDSGWARTGAGITSLQVVGNYKAREVNESVAYFLTYQPIGEREIQEDWWPYGVYYGTMGMYQAQGLGAWGRKAWTEYYPAVTTMLINRQRSDGHWEGGYQPYPTAMALLVLAVPSRYLPIYQR